jgi:hypothetical protein
MTKFQITDGSIKASPAWEVGKWVLSVPIKLLGGWRVYYVRDTEAEIDALMGRLGERHEQEEEESSQAH